MSINDIIVINDGRHLESEPKIKRCPLFWSEGQTKNVPIYAQEKILSSGLCPRRDTYTQLRDKQALH